MQHKRHYVALAWLIMASAEWLLGEGFQHVGEWVDSKSRVHRTACLRRAPGLYAFVVDDKVLYVGKAVALHRRLRNYSRRSFALEQLKAPRRVHLGIAEEVRQGRVVKVYALLSGAGQRLGDLERNLIKQAKPLWNVQSNAGAFDAH